MLSTELFVWLWISKIWLIINDGIKRTTLWAERPASIKRPGSIGFSRTTEIYASWGSVLISTKSFLASYFLYPFLNYCRTLLWGTHLKYLFIVGFCVKLHNLVEFSFYLPFSLSHQKWWKLMLISAYINPENTQLGQVCWKQELHESLKNSWMWNKWNYQARRRTVLFFSYNSQLLSKMLTALLPPPCSVVGCCLLREGSIQLTFQLDLHYASKMVTAGLVLLIIKYFLKNFQAI